ncbi:4466_t:CDS:2 [Scutellospora calospora]|uniref:4466_t:CDS:1 n=1 Tax=Scutellospora calospora TaxID=85575 RepID=A0ACA9KEK3_9GLOM|nr:4466_t:CDS:2 [Scutellospora calospora]
MSKNARVNVIGAGVIGLTSALLLQRNGYQVKILAKHFPGDLSINYTSPWAGAGWLPSLILEKRLQEFQAVGFKIFWTLSEIPDTGVKKFLLLDFLESEPKFENGECWIKNVVPDVFTINVDKYLHWLLNQFTSAGGKTQRIYINHINELMENNNVDVIVNCTGIGAKTLGGVDDLNVFPSRGQTILACAPHIKKVYNCYGGKEFTYVIPRDNDIAKSIIKRCVGLVPELIPNDSRNNASLQNLKIISHYVGLRPSRKGGIRIEIESRKNEKGREIIILHNYGHDAHGYSFSWGTCQKALELLE